MALTRHLFGCKHMPGFRSGILIPDSVMATSSQSGSAESKRFRNALQWGVRKCVMLERQTNPEPEGREAGERNSTGAPKRAADYVGKQKEAASPVPPRYISPSQLSRRWCVSRSTADRIARNNNFTRFVPGRGKNGTVRYLMEEVIHYEESRLIASDAGQPFN
jgi:hypothetical protein